MPAPKYNFAVTIYCQVMIKIIVKFKVHNIYSLYMNKYSYFLQKNILTRIV